MQSESHVFGVTCLKDDVPESIRYAVTAVDTLRAVMIEVVASGVAKIRIPELVEVHRMMNPLCEDISLHITSQHDGQCVNRSDET